MKIKDLMKREVITITKEESVEKALNIMKMNNINGMPVVDEMGNLEGFVVKADIYRFLIEPGHYEVCPVDWVMAKEVVTVSPEESLLKGAKILRDNDIIALPVVEGRKVVGIISIEDILDYCIEKNFL
ncbi:CBS domain-containing protein [Anaerobranca californiensis DSM 14826]|jgi:CBS domain-containing protein|uniref:CBS domain-containing protein n=1 Tax=Anaerobranca californiensis DSM 14826 TaxID=1120989 RepID=A0A1M6RHW2_9FIRM|nr:CBS domain-containing protein [Anaerobranca californiensis]SHK32055.1 CBS domain-containing protein [Anaerobranca californiensis DSM 14826]